MVNTRDLDRDLVQRAKRGDKIAFELLASKYQRKLFRLALRIVGDATDAEDVVQESLIKAYRAMLQFRGDAAFYTWLYRIVINVARNSLESRGRRLPEQSGDNSEDRDKFRDREKANDRETPESLLQGKQITQAISDAMDALPGDLRMAIFLREVEGLRYEEIAQAMDCPIGTVRSRISRARESIAEKIRPLFGEAGMRR